MTSHSPATCTVRNAVTGACGKPATWSNGEFAECAEHAADIVAMARSTHGIYSQPGPSRNIIGDTVWVERHGKRYPATVVKVGERGAVYAEVTYNNGAKRTVRVWA